MDDLSLKLMDDLNQGDLIVVERRLQHKVYGLIRGKYDGMCGRSVLIDTDRSYHVIPTKQITKIRLTQAHVPDCGEPPPVD